MLAIPVSHARQLGLTPRMVVTVWAEDGILLISALAKDTLNGRTPIRRRATQQTP